MKKIYIYAGIGGWILVMAVIALAIGIGSQEQTTQEEENVPEVTEVVESNKIYKMNEMIIHSVDNEQKIAVTVTETTKKIDTRTPQVCTFGYCSDDRKPGMYVVQVSMKITNLSSEKYMDSPYKFRIQDENGKDYGPTSRQFGLGGNLKELSKGESLTAKIKYDIPPPAEDLTLIIKPYWGGEDTLVKLDQIEKVLSNACTGTGECFGGFVTKNVDGATLNIRDVETDQEKRIRLALVDTPEKNEPLFETASEFTAGFCPVGSYVLFVEDGDQKEGSFGRMIGKLYCEGVQLNKKLLENDLAVIDTRFCKDSEFGQEEWAITYGCEEIEQ